MYKALNLSEDKRVLSACEMIVGQNYKDMPKVTKLPNGDITEYKYINGEFVYDPLPVEPEEPVVEEPTQLDRIEAQVTYTAMMTDTLLEV